jgi:alkylation response protein AidB-like acyl-CoA dehydrogenase
MSFELSIEEIGISKLAKEFREKEIDPIVDEVEKTHRIPRELLKKLADVGFLGMSVPVEYGGSATNIISHMLVQEQFAQAGVGVETLVALNNNLPDLLMRFGTSEMKERYIPPICRGEKCASVAFTEPGTGSDPKMIKTTATPNSDSYLLNGNKRFITWGAWPGPQAIFAKDETGKVSAFIMDKLTEGFTTDAPWEKMGIKGVESVDEYLENVKIPKENLLGEKGKGYSILLPWIAGEKIEQSFFALGWAEAVLEESIRYAKTRMLRNGPMSDLQGIQWILGDMKTQVEAIRWLTYKCAYLMEEKSPDWMQMAALDKNFCVPACLDVCRMAMQIHSAYGYTKGKVERLFRSACSGMGMIVSLEINKSIIGGMVIQ